MSTPTKEAVSQKRKTSKKDDEFWEQVKHAAKTPSFWKQNKISIFMAVLCLFFALFSVFLLTDSITIGTLAATSQYKTVKDNVAAKTESDIYERSYKYAERQHHVSNSVSITLGTLQEQAKLEVLKISEVEYETSGSKLGKKLFEKLKNTFAPDVISWMEVPGYGVFTVDLNAAEFIVDHIRQNVIIRVPKPDLTQFTIDNDNVQLLKIEDGGLFKHSVKVGVDIANEQLKSAELSMQQNAKSNQAYYQRACDNAEKIIRTLVTQLNPSIPNLTVNVEFFD